ncbi:GAF domain-containing protein [Algivirga pacifica]|uniref:GAF domain-containing protein n=1 Tax=Algivirga pacifica TaxID=1162670 RepID=A0ABP9DQN5_9BACT
MSNGFPFRLITEQRWDALTHENHYLKEVVDLVQKMLSGNKPMETSLEVEHSVITAVLQHLKEKEQLIEEEQRKQRQNEHQQQLMELIGEHQNLISLCDAVLQFLLKTFQLVQGGVFLVDTIGVEGAGLELKACYAYDRKRYINKTIKAGEGLVGQVLLDRKPLYLSEVPQGYVYITSGIGEATPSYLYIVPLVYNQKVYGVIEVASLYPLTEDDQQRFNSFCDSISANMSMVYHAEQTEILLEETQYQNEVVRAQEEEMRQNMEELKAAQESMERKQHQLQKLNDRLSKGEQLLVKEFEKSQSYQKRIQLEKSKAEESYREVQEQLAEVLNEKDALKSRIEELEVRERKQHNKEKLLNIVLHKSKEREAGMMEKIKELEKKLQAK